MRPILPTFLKFGVLALVVGWAAHFLTVRILGAASRWLGPNVIGNWAIVAVSTIVALALALTILGLGMRFCYTLYWEAKKLEIMKKRTAVLSHAIYYRENLFTARRFCFSGDVGDLDKYPPEDKKQLTPKYEKIDRLDPARAENTKKRGSTF